MSTLKRALGAVAALVALCAFPAAAGAAQVTDNQVARSFDGTPIVYTLFMPDGASAGSPVPAVLITHGWGGTRQTTADGFVGQLLDAGYAVLTWDQRGFGQSGGTVEVDDPDYEARDVSALIDVLAADPRVARDASPAAGVSGPDPEIGMSGGSYAGGIQWITAARDPRVDAIAPEISWHNLDESLIPEGVVKLGWGAALFGVGQTSRLLGLDPGNPAGVQTGGYDSHIDQAIAEGTSTGDFSKDTRDWFAHKGPDYLLPSVRVPTFIIQGTIDDLFPPSQGVKNYAAMKALHPRQPLKLALYCSGHGACQPFQPGPAGYTDGLIVKWFDRYVKERRTVATGPKVEYVTDDGKWHSAADYPVPRAGSRTATGAGTVAVNGSPTASGLVSGSEAPGALEIPIPSAPGTLVGTPRVTLTENGTGTATDEPNKATVFFQIVNKTKHEVVGNQITPKVFDTDGADHSYSFDIEPIAYTVDPGDQLVLQIASTSAMYEAYRGAAVVNFKTVTVDVPVAP